MVIVPVPLFMMVSDVAACVCNHVGIVTAPVSVLMIVIVAEGANEVKVTGEVPAKVNVVKDASANVPMTAADVDVLVLLIDKDVDVTMPNVPIFTFLEPDKFKELNDASVKVVIVFVVAVAVVFVLLLVIVILGTNKEPLNSVNVPTAGMLAPLPEIVTVVRLVSVRLLIVLTPVPVCVSLIVNDVAKSPANVVITKPAVPLTLIVDKLVSFNVVMVLLLPVKVAFDVTVNVPTPFVTV